jgi:hypothetical protein
MGSDLVHTHQPAAWAAFHDAFCTVGTWSSASDQIARQAKLRHYLCLACMLKGCPSQNRRAAFHRARPDQAKHERCNREVRFTPQPDIVSQTSHVRVVPLPDSCTAANSNNVRCIHVPMEGLSTAQSLTTHSRQIARVMELSNVQIRRSNLSARTSPGGWHSPEHPLEGAGKSGLGTVTDQVGNLRKGRTGITELLGRRGMSLRP